MGGTAWSVNRLMIGAVLGVSLGGALGFTVLSAPAGADPPATAVCTSTLAPGTYRSIVVPADDTCDLGVGPVTVLGGVQVESGATFILGHEGGPATGTINGGIAADDAARVQVHDAQINGHVDIQGGSGPFSDALCAGAFVPGACSSDFEDNSINGGATINGFDGFWLGFIRNDVNGTVRITSNTVADQIDIGSNVVHGSLFCTGNDPLENTGESPGPSPNTVAGRDTCNEVAP